MPENSKREKEENDRARRVEIAEQRIAEIEDEIINSEIQRIRLKYADTSDDG